MKGRSRAKIQAVLSKMKKRPKIRHKTVMLSAPHLLVPVLNKVLRYNPVKGAAVVMQCIV